MPYGVIQKQRSAKGKEAMAERIEAFTADHLDGCANLLMITFNAEPWNDSYIPSTTANPIRLEAVTGAF